MKSSSRHFTTGVVWLVVLVFAAIHTLSVAAQISQVVCSNTSSWLENSKGQDPCLMVAYLDGACSVDPTDYTVESLDGPGDYYDAPMGAGATDCRCNTVSYSLLSACAYCQPGNTNLPWSGWTRNCSASRIHVGLYPKPIPEGTAIPAWAFYDVTKTDNWNASIAKSYEGLHIPDSTAPSEPSSTIASSSAFNFTPTFPSPSGSASFPNSTAASTPVAANAVGTNNVGAIVGGVIGGLALLAIIALIITIWVRRSRKEALVEIAGPQPNTPSDWPSTDMHEKLLSIDSATLTPPVVPTSAKLKNYNPNDPSTFPQTFSHTMQSNSLAGRYVGNPEV